MKKFILTILCNAVLLLTLCLPAEARMTIGLISTGLLSNVTQGNIDLLSKELSQKRLPPEPPPVQIVEKQPTPVPQKKPTATVKVKTASTSQIPVQTKVKKKPAIVVPAVTPKPAPEKSQPVKSIKVEPPAVKAPSAAPVDKKIAPASKAQPSETTATEPRPTPGKETFKAEEPAAKPATNKRMTLFIVLVIFAAIIFKTVLFVLRWKKKKESSFRPEVTPTMDTNFHGAEPEVQQSAPVEPLEQVEDDIIEEGRLGPGKVPQLLKRCADLPRPVVLHITKGSCEKLVYFAGGQVSGALTQHLTIDESGVRWNKLGNLLVREALITGEECDRGMALLAKEPGLSFGEALLKLGLIELAGLRHALTRQAKVTIYSLILYPEERYQI